MKEIVESVREYFGIKEILLYPRIESGFLLTILSEGINSGLKNVFPGSSPMILSVITEPEAVIAIPGNLDVLKSNVPTLMGE